MSIGTDLLSRRGFLARGVALALALILARPHDRQALIAHALAANPQSVLGVVKALMSLVDQFSRSGSPSAAELQQEIMDVLLKLSQQIGVIQQQLNLITQQLDEISNAIAHLDEDVVEAINSYRVLAVLERLPAVIQQYTELETRYGAEDARRMIRQQSEGSVLIPLEIARDGLMVDAMRSYVTIPLLASAFGADIQLQALMDREPIVVLADVERYRVAFAEHLNPSVPQSVASEIHRLKVERDAYTAREVRPIAGMCKMFHGTTNPGRTPTKPFYGIYDYSLSFELVHVTGVDERLSDDLRELLSSMRDIAIAPDEYPVVPKRVNETFSFTGQEYSNFRNTPPNPLHNCPDFVEYIPNPRRPREWPNEQLFPDPAFNANPAWATPSDPAPFDQAVSADVWVTEYNDLTSRILALRGFEHICRVMVRNCDEYAATLQELDRLRHPGVPRDGV